MSITEAILKLYNDSHSPFYFTYKIKPTDPLEYPTDDILSQYSLGLAYKNILLNYGIYTYNGNLYTWSLNNSYITRTTVGLLADPTIVDKLHELVKKQFTTRLQYLDTVIRDNKFITNYLQFSTDIEIISSNIELCDESKSIAIMNYTVKHNDNIKDIQLYHALSWHNLQFSGVIRADYTYVMLGLVRYNISGFCSNCNNFYHHLVHYLTPINDDKLLRYNIQDILETVDDYDHENS